MRNLNPSFKVEDITNTNTSEVNIRYRQGIPLSYRFDASRGIVNFDGRDTVSGKNGEFSFVPVAMRIFESELFDYSRRLWAELFFINADGNMSCIMFHGYSVEELKSLESDLYYSDLKINEVVLTMKPEKKESKETGNAFYIATFDFEKADKDYLDVVNTCIKDFKIYRQDTRRDLQDIQLSINYELLPEVHQLSEATTVNALPSATEEVKQVETAQTTEPQNILDNLKAVNQGS